MESEPSENRPDPSRGGYSDDDAQTKQILPSEVVVGAYDSRLISNKLDEGTYGPSSYRF